MKRTIEGIVLALSVSLLLTGCISLGGGSRTETHPPTVGQQLVDLQKARDAGAITDEEFQAKKSVLLTGK